MQVHYAPAIQADEPLFGHVREATELLQREVRSSRFWDSTSVSWTLNQFDGRESVLGLSLTNGEAKAYFGFSASRLKTRDNDYVLDSMRRLWGDLLEAISHEQLKARGDIAPSKGYLDGDEALERILDSVADYSEREGHGPDSLKLPMRYATALMKLGPTYWGDYYRQIRESGLKAFEGQTLLGMKVELIPGVDAELQVA